MTVKLIDKANAILEQYRKENHNKTDHVFPYLLESTNLSQLELRLKIMVSTTSINLRLKEIAALSGITKNLTTHVARHTFASISARRMNPTEVMALLGHSKLSMTQIYISEINHDERFQSMDKFASALD